MARRQRRLTQFTRSEKRGADQGEGATAASDVYGLGATLLAATRGTPPYGWPGEDVFALLDRIGKAEDPADVGNGPLADVLGAMTATRPGDRPTATEVAALLSARADRVELPPWDVPDHDRPPSDEETTAPGRSQRRWALAGTAALTAILLATAALTLGGGSSDAPPPAPDPASDPDELPAAVGPLEIGDQRTVDVCAFLDPGALSGFGEGVLTPGYGRLNTCRVTLDQPGSAEIAVGAALDPPTSSQPEGVAQELGDTVLLRRPGSETECSRVLWLSDGTRVMLTSNYNGSGTPTDDMCAIAETVAATAARGLAERGIVRRDPPGGAGTLWAADACTLLDGADLAVLPTVPDDSFRGFGGWDCQYGDDADPETSIQLSFSRLVPPAVDEDLTPAPSAPDTVFTELDDDTCFAHAGYRPTTGTTSDGEPLAEVVLVRVRGPLSDDELCAAATSLTTAAISSLPSPSP